jgi:hypothetical protein
VGGSAWCVGGRCLGSTEFVFGGYVGGGRGERCVWPQFGESVWDANLKNFFGVCVEPEVDPGVCGRGVCVLCTGVGVVFAGCALCKGTGVCVVQGGHDVCFVF